jgi:hypothetical protein
MVKSDPVTLPVRSLASRRTRSVVADFRYERRSETAVSTPGFRGCRYIAADLALTNPGHPVHAETRAHRQWLHEMFETELDTLGHPDPARAADELLFLIEGALVSGVTRPSTSPGRTARRLAEHVIDG